ncbi:MAG: hypothetical protein Q4E13_05530 [Clostridia bacterium]|nr:hypothetical protein [Clostridia bacterium]
MQRTPPLRNGHYFRYDEWSVKTGLAGQQYYSAKKYCLNGQNKECLVNASDNSYVLVECCDVWSNEAVFCDWYSKIGALEKSARRPIFLTPIMVLNMSEGNAAWIAKFAGEDCQLVSRRSFFGDAALFAETYAYGAAMAKKHGLQMTNLFFDERSKRLLIDTSPGKKAGDQHGAEWLKKYLRRCARHLSTHVVSDDCQNVYYAFRDLNDNRRDLQGADEKTEPFAVELNFVLTRKASALPLNRPTVSRSRKLLSLDQLAPSLKSIFPDQNAAVLMELKARDDNGLLYLINKSENDWMCNRNGGMVVHPEGEIQLRRGEEISIPVDRNTELSITVHRFVTRRIRERQVNSVAAHRAQAVMAAPAKKDQADATQQMNSVQLEAPKAVRQPFEELYDYYSGKFPECGESVTAEEKATGKRVRIDMHASNEVLLEQLCCQTEEQFPPLEGFCRLRKIHANVKDSSFAVVCEEPARRGYVQVGSPQLEKLDQMQRYEVGQAMMEKLEHAAGRGWIPKDFFEHSLLIHPDTRETVFLGGAYLCRSGKMPFECTLGYSTPALGEEGRIACEAALYYAAAVWLYRLLVGGYPLEGRAAREMARQRCIGEAAVLSEGNVPFVFSRTDRSNSIEGLGASFDEQIVRYGMLDERIRQGFEQVFCDPKNALRGNQWTPGRWADLLRKCAKGG